MMVQTLLNVVVSLSPGVLGSSLKVQRFKPNNLDVFAVGSFQEVTLSPSGGRFECLSSCKAYMLIRYDEEAATCNTHQSIINVEWDPLAVPSATEYINTNIAATLDTVKVKPKSGSFDATDILEVEICMKLKGKDAPQCCTMKNLTGPIAVNTIGVFDVPDSECSGITYNPFEWIEAPTVASKLTSSSGASLEFEVEILNDAVRNKFGNSLRQFVLAQTGVTDVLPIKDTDIYPFYF